MSTETVSLPEAAFSLNLKGKLNGVEAQLTVRGQSYQEFATNVAAVRGLLDAPTVATSAPPATSQTTAAPTPEGWCVIHSVQMKQQNNQRDSWYSHKTADGGWCKGK